jgi:hypothetical protein
MYHNEYWGGARTGAGRPKKLPTKPVRLNADEQELIQLIRDKDLLALFLETAKKKHVTAIDLI